MTHKKISVLVFTFITMALLSACSFGLPETGQTTTEQEYLDTVHQGMAVVGNGLSRLTTVVDEIEISKSVLDNDVWVNGIENLLTDMDDAVSSIDKVSVPTTFKTSHSEVEKTADNVLELTELTRQLLNGDTSKTGQINKLIQKIYLAAVK